MMGKDGKDYFLPIAAEHFAALEDHLSDLSPHPELDYPNLYDPINKIIYVVE